MMGLFPKLNIDYNRISMQYSLERDLIFAWNAEYDMRLFSYWALGRGWPSGFPRSG